MYIYTHINTGTVYLTMISPEIRREPFMVVSMFPFGETRSKSFPAFFSRDDPSWPRRLSYFSACWLSHQLVQLYRVEVSTWFSWYPYYIPFFPIAGLYPLVVSPFSTILEHSYPGRISHWSPPSNDRCARFFSQDDKPLFPEGWMPPEEASQNRGRPWRLVLTPIAGWWFGTSILFSHILGC